MGECFIPYEVLNVIARHYQLQYYVQRTLCHSEELHCNDVRIPRKRTLFIIWSPFREIATLRSQ